MKKNLLLSIFSLIAALFISGTGFAQEKLASPRETATGKIGKANVSVNYGSPSVKGRKIWGDLVPYNEVWRTGANEATVFKTDKDLYVEGKTLKAGEYSFFAIPTEGSWTIIFNKTVKQWGAYDYKEKDDVLRVTVKPVKSATMHERLIYTVNANGIVLQWENLEVPVAMK